MNWQSKKVVENVINDSNQLGCSFETKHLNINMNSHRFRIGFFDGYFLFA